MEAELYKSDIYVGRECGYTLKIHYGYTEDCRLHYHDYFEFFLTMSGGTIHMINGEEQMLPAHALVLVRDRDIHGYTKGEEFSFVNLSFSREIAEGIRAYFGKDVDDLYNRKMPPTVILSDEEYAKVMRRLDGLMSLEINDSRAKTTEMKLILIDLISHFIKSKTEKSESTAPVWLTELTQILSKPTGFNLSLPDMSEISGKSVEHISRSFKKHLGMTASEFMNSCKLTYAANLLMNTNLSILEVCYESGFQNLSWFYRKFKERFGEAPLALRQGASNALPL